ncbi:MULTISPECIES: nitrite reductase small subunit NirD, partial [unclassified Microcoleus]|uniref:nitrite reductase small subunit NirD n=1 Tax=unclassified Microcoleus TaxID=2642155 RepID=UPI002FD4EB92
SFLFAVLISTVNFQFDVFAKVRCTHEVYGLSNYDPFSKAFVLSRGLVGDRSGTLKVASPIYKQNFSLATGQCLDDETVTIPTFRVRVAGDRVQVAVT